MSLLNAGNSLSSGPVVLCLACPSLVSALPLESPFLKLQIWWGQSPSGAPEWTPTELQTRYCCLGGSSHISLQHHLPHAPPSAQAPATLIITSQLMLLPLPRALSLPVLDLLSPALCLSRPSLEISASQKLSLGSLSPGQVPLVSGPMEPCTSLSCWIIIACLPVSSVKLRSPWQLGLCLRGSWLCLVLCVLSSWEVLKMYLLNE